MCCSRRAFKVNGTSELSQRNKSIFAVFSELRDELVRTAEFPRFPKEGHKIDPDAISVEVARNVKQMSLDRDLHVAERRPGSEVHHSAKLTRRSLNHHRINPFRRQEFP